MSYASQILTVVFCFLPWTRMLMVQAQVGLYELDSMFYVVSPLTLNATEKAIINGSFRSLVNGLLADSNDPIVVVDDSVEVYDFGQCPLGLARYDHCESASYRMNLRVTSNNDARNFQIYSDFVDATHTAIHDGRLEEIIDGMNHENIISIEDAPEISQPDRAGGDRIRYTRGPTEPPTQVPTELVTEEEETETPWYKHWVWYGIVAAVFLVGVIVGCCLYWLCCSSKQNDYENENEYGRPRNFPSYAEETDVTESGRGEIASRPYNQGNSKKQLTLPKNSSKAALPPPEAPRSPSKPRSNKKQLTLPKNSSKVALPPSAAPRSPSKPRSSKKGLLLLQDTSKATASSKSKKSGKKKVLKLLGSGETTDLVITESQTRDLMVPGDRSGGLVASDSQSTGTDLVRARSNDTVVSESRSRDNAIPKSRSLTKR